MSLAQDPPPQPPPKLVPGTPKTLVRIRVGKEPLAPGMLRVFWVASQPLDVKWAEAEVLSVLRDLEPSRLKPVEAGTAEESALKASVAASAQLVPPPGESAGLFTMRTVTGDVLVSRHEQAWLWSGPWYEKLIYDIDLARFDDDDAMVRFMDGFFLWTGFPRTVQLAWNPSEDKLNWLTCGLELHYDQQQTIPRAWCTAVRAGQRAHLVLATPSNVVAERFPPLQERLKSYSTDTLLAEIGRVVDSRYGPPACRTCSRDNMAVDELATRTNLTIADIKAAVMGPENAQVGYDGPAHFRF